VVSCSYQITDLPLIFCRSKEISRAQSENSPLKAIFFRSKRFFGAQSDFHRARREFHTLKTIFLRSGRFSSAQSEFSSAGRNFRALSTIFTRLLRISTAQRNLQLQLTIYHLPFVAEIFFSVDDSFRAKLSHSLSKVEKSSTGLNDFVCDKE
jgi:hypothetical protein